MNHWRRALSTLRARDPGLRAVERSVRAAVLVPTVFALARAVSANPEVSLFAAFGSFGLLLMVDLTGSPAHRLRAYGALCGAGVAFIGLGTACSRHPVVAPLVMAGVAFVVLYAGVFSPATAAASTGALLTFVLPVCVTGPPSQIPARVGGWLLASAICLPAVLLIWPGRWHDGLRKGLAEALRALADATNRRVADPTGDGGGPARQRVEEAVNRLRDQFEQTPYPPTGSGPEDLVVARLVSRMEWLSTYALRAASDLHAVVVPVDVRDLTHAAASVLDALAQLVDPAQGRGPRPGAVAGLKDAADALQQCWSDSLARITETLISETLVPETPVPEPGVVPNGPDAGAAAARVDSPLTGIADAGFRARVFASVTLDSARSVLGLIGIEVVAGRVEALHQSLARAQTTGQIIRTRIASHATVASVWFRNSIRGAMALALAVGVVEITDVSHGFWVVLGTLSVLRSNAQGTGASAIRAVSGTLVGFVIGSVIMLGVGHHVVLLWVALPLAVLVAGVAPTLISFAAAQAGFTVTVIVLFNIIQPAGWHVGLVRVFDVAMGSGVSVAVGLLFWPRGASRSLLLAVGRACSTYSWWFAHAVERLGSADQTTADPDEARAVATHYLLHEAFRQFLAERGAKPMSLPSVTHLVAAVDGIRLAASNLATLPRVPVATDGRVSPAVERAHRQVADACRTTAQWFDELQIAIDRGRAWRTAPPRRSMADAPGGDRPSVDVPAGDQSVGSDVPAGDQPMGSDRPASSGPPTPVAAGAPVAGVQSAVDDDLARRMDLVAAVSEVRRLARADEVRAVLRLVWADQGLEEQLRLQGRLRDIALTPASDVASPVPG